MLEDRRDIAVLWDIRVAAEARGQGVGTTLFRAVEKRAVAQGRRKLKSKHKTSTCQRAGSMRSKVAYWERFTGLPIRNLRMRRNCSGIKTSHATPDNTCSQV